MPLDNVIIFDTTMRDGELMPGVKMQLDQKIHLAQLLEAIGVDVIEVGYPGHAEKDFEEIFNVSKLIKTSTVCGLAHSQPTEILQVAEALKPAQRGRIHIYTPVNLNHSSQFAQTAVLNTIAASVSLARSYCGDVEWSAFDAPRSEPDFLCEAVETAIANGATTVSIPDTLGLLSSDRFSSLLTMIFNRVPNIDRAIVSVHCHNDLDLAVDNSIAALDCGARQIECSINGLGARKGNADLAKVVTRIRRQQTYHTAICDALLDTAAAFVSEITNSGKPRSSIC